MRFQSKFTRNHPLSLLLLVALIALAACEPIAGPNNQTTTTEPTPASDVLARPAETADAIAEVSSAYPPPVETLMPYPEPWLTASPTGMGYPPPLEADALTTTAEPVYFPVIGEGELQTAAPSPTVTVIPLPSPTASVTPTPISVAAIIGPTPTPTRFAPLDFESARLGLESEGQVLVHNKIGLHVTFPENNQELDTYMQRLDEAGVPFFLKSVDNAEPLFRAQELMKASGVDHTLVFRSTKYDVPEYTADPIKAAEAFWELEKETWPPELDPQLVWFETMNEVDRNHSEWLAQFAKRTAELALRDGFKWAAFGWASGEPEPEAWRSPAMLDFLQLVAEHPDQLAIALHEYSYLAEDIGHDYPFKIGRFMDLFRAADENGIPRPTVLITEWGWTYNNIPSEADAMEDIRWAAELYGAFPEVKGAGIWNLGRLEDVLMNLNWQVGDLVDDLMVLSLNSYYEASVLPQQTSTDAGQFSPP